MSKSKNLRMKQQVIKAQVQEKARKEETVTEEIKTKAQLKAAALDAAMKRRKAFIAKKKRGYDPDEPQAIAEAAEFIMIPMRRVGREGLDY